MNIEKIEELPEEIDVLVNESLENNFRAIEKLKNNYLNGSNSFSKAGEALFAAFENTKLVGICGLNIDPYTQNQLIGRVRHLYVLKQYRRKGVGKALVRAVEMHALHSFSRLGLYTGEEESTLFYNSMGYSNQCGEHVSHIKQLKP